MTMSENTYMLHDKCRVAQTGKPLPNYKKCEIMFKSANELRFLRQIKWTQAV